MLSVFGTINYLAVAAAALSCFFVGGLWYSPLLFGKPWMKANGFTEESLRASSPLPVVGGSLALALCAATMLAALMPPGAGLGQGALAGCAAIVIE